MKYKSTRLGMDRFIALSWVNMALELRVDNRNNIQARQQLQDWLSHEISGKESAIKTASQISRIWLSVDDPYADLRRMAFESGLVDHPENRPFLHYGMALNVFPVFKDICKITGRLLNLQPECTRRDISQRVNEIYGNPESVQRASRRVLQTLEDWGYLMTQSGIIRTSVFFIDDPLLIEWIIVALLKSQSTERVPLTDLSKAPELLGIRFQDVRSAIFSASNLRIERVFGTENIIITE